MESLQKAVLGHRHTYIGRTPHEEDKGRDLCLSQWMPKMASKLQKLAENPGTTLI